LTASNLDLENLNLLLNQGLFVYCKDSKGNSLLHVAFQQFDREEANARKICERLLKLGLDPNKLNSHNQSPLHLAVLYRFMPIIGLSLRKKKAIEFAINYNKGPGFPKFDFHLVDESDHTTLMHLATASGDPEIISLLYARTINNKKYFFRIKISLFSMRTAKTRTRNKWPTQTCL
jgi:ankyrin repeat protein